MRLGLVAVATLAVLVANGPVSADRTRVTDRNDVPTPLDIVWVKHQHDRLEGGRHRIRHTISMHEPWSGRRLFPRSCWNIAIDIDNPGRRIEFYWEGRVKSRLDDRELKTWRPDRRSVAVRVPPRLLTRGDGAYRWRAVTLATEGGTCEGGEEGFVDLAPGERWIRHDL